MSDLIDRRVAYETLTDYYHHRTDIQHMALCDALNKVPSAQPDVPDTNVGDMISRQAAIDALHGYFDGMLETDTWSPCDVYGLIEILPSADTVEVVRCKDCYHYDAVTRRCFMSFLGGYEPTDFCSYGERKDE